MVRDKLGAAWCPGSGFMFNRKAWEAVGGFSITSMADDVLFGWTLNGKGYATGAITERLQSGMQPSSFADHIKQRRRWNIGTMRNAYELGYGFNTRKLGKMTYLQKLCCLNVLPKPFVGTIGKALAWLIFFIVITSGQQPVQTKDTALLAHIMGSYATSTVASRLGEYLQARSYDLGNIRRRQIVSTWRSIHLAKASLQELMPAWLGGATLGFLVTGLKNASHIELEERDFARRPGMIERVRRLHAIEGVLYHFYFFVAVATAVLMNLYIICVRRLNIASSNDIQLAALIAAKTVLFPALRLELLFTFLSPLWYIMFPPVEPPRGRYLKADPVSGGGRPKPEARGVVFTRGMLVWEVLFLAATAWSVTAWYLVACEAGTV
jgi:hypothetical protein